MAHVTFAAANTPSANVPQQPQVLKQHVLMAVFAQPPIDKLYATWDKLEELENEELR